MIIASQVNTERNFYQKWIWICAVGFVVGGVVSILGGGSAGYFWGNKVVVFLNVPLEMRQATSDFLASFLKGIVDAAITSLFQWTLLRRFLPNANWWIVAGVLGDSIGNAVSSIALSSTGNPEEARFVYLFCISLVVIIPLTSAFNGFLEWLVLRRNFQNATRWIRVRVIADIVVAVISLIEFIIRTSLGFTIWSLLVLVLFGVIEGVAFGTITGEILGGFVKVKSEAG